MGCCFTGTSGKTNTDRETCEALGGIYHGDEPCDNGPTGTGPGTCFIMTIFRESLANQMMLLGGNLQSQYDFREAVLKPTEKGKKFIEIYYKCNPIAREIILSDPRLMGESIAIFWELLPKIKSIVDHAMGKEKGAPQKFEDDDYRKIEAFLFELQKKTDDKEFADAIETVLCELKMLIGKDSEAIIKAFNSQ